MSAEQARTPASFTLAVLARRARRSLIAPVRVWRRSLRVRTVAITLLLSSVALLAVGTVVSYTIAQGLFVDRVHQAESTSLSARDAAQTTINSSGSSERTSLDAVQVQAINSVIQVAKPTGYAWLNDPVPGQPTAQSAVSLDGVQNLVSAQLQKSVREGSG